MAIGFTVYRWCDADTREHRPKRYWRETLEHEIRPAIPRSAKWFGKINFAALLIVLVFTDHPLLGMAAALVITSGALIGHQEEIKAWRMLAAISAEQERDANDEPRQ